MTNTAFLQLEQRVEREEKRLPSFTSAIKDFFLDIFSHERYLQKEMQEHISHGRLEQAAHYAIQLKQYEHAFRLYDQSIAKGHRLAKISAAELAEYLGNYEQGLQYRLRADDYVHAAIDAAHMGRHDEANLYMQKLHEA